MALFTLFLDLPTELRLRIWYFSLPGPQTIVILQPNDKYSLAYHANKLTKNPTTLSINQESRMLTLSHYQTFEQPYKTKWQYIDFSIDTVRLPVCAIWQFHPRVNCQLNAAGNWDMLTSRDVQRIQVLELTSPLLRWEEVGCLKYLGDAMAATLGSLRRLSLRLLRDEKDNSVTRVRIEYLRIFQSMERIVKDGLRRLYKKRAMHERMERKPIVLVIELPDGQIVDTVVIGSENGTQ